MRFGSRQNTKTEKEIAAHAFFSPLPPPPPTNNTSDPPTKELILSLNASKPQHLKFVIEDRLDDEHLLVDAKAAAEVRRFVRAKGEEVAFQPPPREAAA